MAMRRSPAMRRSSLSARRAWIEICTRIDIVKTCRRSLSARRAWIEITVGGAPLEAVKQVALRKESVDRNSPVILPTSNARVALRKESVDRNSPT